MKAPHFPLLKSGFFLSHTGAICLPITGMWVNKHEQHRRIPYSLVLILPLDSSAKKVG
jgi:hypothetical protein